MNEITITREDAAKIVVFLKQYILKLSRSDYPADEFRTYVVEDVAGRLERSLAK